MTVGSKTFTQPLYLDSGRILEPYTLVYETYGELNEEGSNAVLICHAFSGSHHVSGRYEGESKSGWWDALVGESKAIDTKKYFVICINVIGSCFGSTGPQSPKLQGGEPYLLRFPVITIRDMVRAQRTLLTHIGIHHLHAIVGGSMGGMQALVFAVEYPDFANIVIPMATTYATTPWVIAMNKVAQAALLADPAFKNGRYDPNEIKKNGFAGLEAARMTGYLGYLSPQQMGEKFGRNYVRDDGLFELFGRFEVERYLDYNGGNFPKFFDPLSFLYLAKAINIFDLGYGYDSLDDALSKVSAKLFLLSFRGDTLFFPQEMKHIYDRLVRLGRGDLVHYLNIDSHYGHDAFLVETDKFDSLVVDILEGRV